MKRVFFAAICISCVIPFSASALARAVFPKSSSQLQPPPRYTQPNVSGNVNSTLDPSLYESQGSEQDTAATNDSGVSDSAAPSDVVPAADDDTGAAWWHIAILGLLPIVAGSFAFVWLRHSMKESD